MGGCGQQEDLVVTEEDVVNRVKRSSSWKAAGPDGVRAFWFKTFTSLHSALATALQECLNRGNLLGWMVKGKTLLIQRYPAKETSQQLQDNCLFTTYVKVAHRDLCR